MFLGSKDNDTVHVFIRTGQILGIGRKKPTAAGAVSFMRINRDDDGRTEPAAISSFYLPLCLFSHRQ
jgi:hypothetical protein